MALTPGTALGAFEITGNLGVGGMGEVYRATDTKLGRDVAVKTLPSALAEDADRLARFEREARLLASLNHAHIASVYSLDKHDGTLYIAMELVEGETLEEKLKAGPLPVEDALQLGLQIALALEAAHEKGVVHRDLKPANVMVTPEGVVKVLDFGLAKAFSGEPDEGSPAYSPSLSLAMTQQGLVLGTAGYMSPEQASGQATDQRADIWAFGVVLYEMLTGMPVFSGESVPHILADVLKTEPDWDRLPKDLDPRLRLLLERCLAKKARSRLHSIADARIEIEAVLSDPAGLEPSAAAVGAPRPGRLAAAIVVTFGLTAGLAMLLASRFWPEAEPGRVTRFVETIDLPGVSSDVAITLDGFRVAFTAGDPRAIYVRHIDELGIRPVPDTVRNVPGPGICFSPDGAWIAFSTAERTALRRAPIAGGPGLTVADSLSDIGAGAAQPCDWADDGHIYFAGGDNSILRVPEAGGSVETITSGDTASGELDVGMPQLLPGGTKLLFVGLRVTGGSLRLSANVHDLVSGERTTLLEDAGFARFVPGPDASLGHLVLGQDNALFAAPFDVERLAVGAASPIAENVSPSVLAGLTTFALSATGTLAYMSGESGGDPALAARSIDVLDRDGVPSTLLDDGRRYVDITFSPEGQRYVVVISERDAPGADLWRHDLAGGPMVRLTFSGSNGPAVWTPDGRRVIYSSVHLEPARSSLESIPADGGEPPVTLWSAAGLQRLSPDSVSPDGTILMGTYVGDIWLLPLQDPPGEAPAAELQYLLETDFTVRDARFSPDGRWVAYSSNESGRAQVHVIPYPGPGGKWQVSVDGGNVPRWNPSGGELFFLDGPRLMVADVETGDGFRILGQPRVLFEDPALAIGIPTDQYDVSPDGTQFLMVRRAADAPGESTAASTDRLQLHVVQNWFEELNRIVPLE